MKDSKKDFFISYTKQDQQQAEWIAMQLEDSGYTTIIQCWDFKPGTSFVAQMHNALINCERFIAVISPAYFESGYCQAEWTSAFTKDPNFEKALFVPIKIKEFKPEGLFSSLIYIDLCVANEEIAKKTLLDGLRTDRMPKNRPGFTGTNFCNNPGQLPFNNIPHIRNPHFTGRNEILESIRQTFNDGQYSSLTQSIIGLGGVGKTQIVLEYAYKNGYLYEMIWWVNAESIQTIVEGYTNFAHNNNIIDQSIQKFDLILESVWNWMTKHNRWLFIYDNAENIETIYNFLPRLNTGHILITSRHTGWTSLGKEINIEMFSPDEATRFLIKKTNIDEYDNARDLANLLGFLPLALEQASEYINNNKINYCKYYSIFKKYALRLFAERDSLPKDYKYPIIITWNISISKIELESAKQLLFLCSFFAAENIDKNIFIISNKLLPEPLSLDVLDELKYNRIIFELVQYSIIKYNNGQIFVHPLVQEVIKNSVEESSWLKCCLEIINNLIEMDFNQIETRNTISKYIKHALSIANYAFEMSFHIEMVSKIYYYVANYYKDTALYSYALPLYLKMLIISKLLYGEEHYFTALIYQDISDILHTFGDFKSALKWGQDALSIIVKVFGEEHQNTAKLYCELTGICVSLNKYDEALIYCQKSINIFKKVFGKEHQSIAAAYNNMAVIYSNQLDYDEALNYYNKALVIGERMHAKETDIARAYNNIAHIYFKKANYKLSLEWYKKALLIREKVSTEHPDTAIMYNNVANVYDIIGDIDQAIMYQKKALQIREKVLDKNNRITAQSYFYIGKLYEKQNKYDKALNFLKKAAKAYEYVDDIDYGELFEVYMSVAEIYKEKKQMEKAVLQYRKLLKIAVEKTGKYSEDTIEIYLRIVSIYDIEEQYSKELEIYLEASESFINVFGAEHVKIMALYSKIARLYFYLRDYTKMLEWYQKTYSICEKINGKEHTDTATILSFIARAYSEVGEYNKAIECYEGAINIWNNFHMIDNLDIASSYKEIAYIYNKKEEYTKALEMYQKAFSIQEKLLPSEDPELLLTFTNIAHTYSNLHDYSSALEWYQKVINIKSQTLGSNDYDLYRIYFYMANIYEETLDYQKSVEYYLKSFKILNKYDSDSASHKEDVKKYLEGVYLLSGGEEKDFDEWLNKNL